MDGDDFNTDTECRAFLGDNYLRIAPVFPPGVNIAMDTVDKMDYMLQFADTVEIGPALEWLYKKWK